MQNPSMDPKVIHPMTVSKEKADKTKENPTRVIAERNWRSILPHSSYEISSAGHVMMAIHDAFHSMRTKPFLRS